MRFHKWLAYYILTYSLTSVKSEHVVEAEEATAWVWGQVENLGEHERGLTIINKQLSDDKDNHAIVLGVRLAISANELVLDLLERKSDQLVDDVLSSLELLTLEGEERLFTVKGAKGRTIGVESIVVMLNELTTDRIELGVHRFHCLY